jgi:Domain of unknown function (DUF4262)
MTGLDEFHRRESWIIDTFGWAVTAVLPPTDDPDATSPFVYTVGLTAHGHPELLIAGLEVATSQALLNDVAARVYGKGERFIHGQQIDDLIIGYPAVIVNGPPTPELWPGAAIARYGRDRVRLQQIVWPDDDGRFPWHDGYAHEARVQKLIGRP